MRRSRSKLLAPIYAEYDAAEASLPIRRESAIMDEFGQKILRTDFITLWKMLLDWARMAPSAFEKSLKKVPFGMLSQWQIDAIKEMSGFRHKWDRNDWSFRGLEGFSTGKLRSHLAIAMALFVADFRKNLNGTHS